ncbi:hypothetical protein CALCODRAFT_198463 [Calocera cornea HHB12733]|uniref:Uncharacterized protein n=1 Tax=Calocera cornea HHB12733 TaxID=1353952 RepID=A0A165HFK7_9BASI|nr:hypothetical protein CALCODRAFT_198463 [Calocera cornea HHB12733]
MMTITMSPARPLSVLFFRLGGMNPNAGQSGWCDGASGRGGSGAAGSAGGPGTDDWTGAVAGFGEISGKRQAPLGCWSCSSTSVGGSVLPREEPLGPGEAPIRGVASALIGKPGDGGRRANEREGEGRSPGGVGIGGKLASGSK